MPDQKINYIDDLQDTETKQLNISDVYGKFHFKYNPFGTIVEDSKDLVNFYFHGLLVRKLLEYHYDTQKNDKKSCIKILNVETIINIEEHILSKICIFNQGKSFGWSVKAIEPISKGTLSLYTGELLFCTKSQEKYLYNTKDQTYFISYFDNKMPLDRQTFEDFIRKVKNIEMNTDGLESCLQNMYTDEEGNDLINVKYTIDAKKEGTFARFIQFIPTDLDGFNCQGEVVATANVETIPYYVLLQSKNNDKKFIPGCLLQTTRDIKPDEMLGFDYSSNKPEKVLFYFAKTSKYPPMLFNTVGKPLAHLQLAYIEYLINQTNKKLQMPLPFSHNELCNCWEEKAPQIVEFIQQNYLSPLSSYTYTPSYTQFNDPLKKQYVATATVATCEPPPGSKVVNGKTIVPTYNNYNKFHL